jgi:hypothetical protein
MNNSIQEAGGQPLFEVGPDNSMMNEELTTASPEIKRYLAREMAHSNFSNTHPRVLSMVHRLWTRMRHNIDEKGVEAQQDFMLKAQEQLQRAESFKDGYLEIKDRFSKSMLKEDNLRFYFFEPAEETLKDFAIKQLENAFLEESSNENHEKKGESSLKKDFETFIKSDIFQARLEERVSQIYNGLLEQSPELHEAVNERVVAESTQHRKGKNHESIEDIMKQSLEDMFHLIVIPLLDHQV